MLSRWTALRTAVRPGARGLPAAKGILNENEGGLFLGIATPVLAFIAYRASGPKLRPWIITGLVFFLLSFGCYLNIGGVDQLPPPVLLVFAAAALCRAARVATWRSRSRCCSR